MKCFGRALALLFVLSAPSLSPAQISTTRDASSQRDISPGGLFVEPLLQGSRQDTTIKTSQLPLISDDTSGRTEGYGLGAKLGVHVSEAFFLGVDGRYTRSQFRDSTYSEATGDDYTYGPTAGLQMPFLGIRLLGTYVAGGEFNPGAGTGEVDLKFREARGWRYGAGLRVAAVSVNLEYQDLTYNRTDIESFGSLPGSAETNVDYGTRGYLLSLSFPVEL